MTISRESLWTAIGVAAFGVAVAIDKAGEPDAYTVTITAYVSDAQRPSMSTSPPRSHARPPTPQ